MRLYLLGPCKIIFHLSHLRTGMFGASSSWAGWILLDLPNVNLANRSNSDHTLGVFVRLLLAQKAFPQDTIIGNETAVKQ